MLKSLTIKNFRCFENFNIESLDRINLIGGSNNVGKTTLLEALFLLTGVNERDIPFRVNFLRGIETKNLGIGDVIQWLFFNTNVEKSVEISATDTGEKSRVLKIALSESEEEILPLDESSQDEIPQVKENGFQNLKLQYQQNEAEPAIWKIQQKGRFGFRTNMKSETIERHPKTEFVGGIRGWRLTTDVIEKFSNLEKVNRQGEILETLRILEPRLKRLAILVTGEVPTIYGALDIGHLVPLQMMGEGMLRLTAMALIIANTKNGTVLIDEIENGLHHSVLVKVWKAIAYAARRSNTQIFATTHSLELIRAAHKAFSTEEPYDFRYHRLDRIGDIVKCITYDRETIETSVDMNFEMR